MIRAILLALLFAGNARAVDTIAVFSAKWCGPCQQYKQTLRGQKTPIRLVFVDIDERPDLKDRFGIQKVPTTVWWINKREAAREIGVLPVQRLNAVTRAVLQKAGSSARSALKAAGKITKKAAAAVAGSNQNTPGDALVLPPHHR